MLPWNIRAADYQEVSACQHNKGMACPQIRLWCSVSPTYFFDWHILLVPISILHVNIFSPFALPVLQLHSVRPFCVPNVRNFSDKPSMRLEILSNSSPYYRYESIIMLHTGTHELFLRLGLLRGRCPDWSFGWPFSWPLGWSLGWSFDRCRFECWPS